MVGQELGSYRVLQSIGKGGMASVYLGEHKMLGHRVAIKVLHPKHLANASIERRFFNEAQAIAKIRHPSVVQIFDYGRGGADGFAYIVMEYLEGESLRGRIRAGVMEEKHVALFGRQVALGLGAAHEVGIIHRDLKPDNVFLIPDSEVDLGERAKVIDFGIAKQRDLSGPASEHTATGILVGTPAYMSPEQCKGNGQVDSRSDIYSLGVVLYRMATNQLPFESTGTGELIGKHLYVAPSAPRELNPLISAEMSDVILRCLKKEPEERYQSMAELAAALRQAPGLTAEARPEAAAEVAETAPVSLVASPAPVPRSTPPALTPHSTPPAPQEIAASPVEEETHPTTLRAATGESSQVGRWAPGLSSRRPLIYAGLAALALAAAILIAAVPDRGGGRQAAGGGPEAQAESARPAGAPTDEATPSARGGAAEEVDAPEGEAAEEERAPENEEQLAEEAEEGADSAGDAGPAAGGEAADAGGELAAEEDAERAVDGGAGERAEGAEAAGSSGRGDEPERSRKARRDRRSAEGGRRSGRQERERRRERPVREGGRSKKTGEKSEKDERRDPFETKAVF